MISGALRRRKRRIGPFSECTRSLQRSEAQTKETTLSSRPRPAAHRHRPAVARRPVRQCLRCSRTAQALRNDAAGRGPRATGAAAVRVQTPHKRTPVRPAAAGGARCTAWAGAQVAPHGRRREQSRDQGIRALSTRIAGRPAPAGRRRGRSRGGAILRRRKRIGPRPRRGVEARPAGPRVAESIRGGDGAAGRIRRGS